MSGLGSRSQKIHRTAFLARDRQARMQGGLEVWNLGVRYSRLTWFKWRSVEGGETESKLKHLCTLLRQQDLIILFIESPKHF